MIGTASKDVPVSDIRVANLNPAQDALFAADTIWPIFDRLRNEAPVHFTQESHYGPFWSVTRHDDIVAVEADVETFTSTQGTALISLESQANARTIAHRHFMDMDPPRHGPQRRTIMPALAPSNLAKLKPLIRERAAGILDALPIGEEFDWVERVSKELTSMMLATLLDFPQEHRRKLTHWSDVLTSSPGHGPVTSWEQKAAEIQEFNRTFVALRESRKNGPPSFDLVSMLAHGEATRDQEIEQYIMNMSLLLIGGNDTTRNTISGSVCALDANPHEYRKLKENPALVPSMVAETIRWQTPIAHMIRTATRETELGGQPIAAGDKIVLWYVSANRDERVIPDPYAYRIDREQPRVYLSFGHGIHRCVGNGLATLQLTIIWEEILKRFPQIVVTGEPRRTHSVRFRGYEKLPVLIPQRW
jgi:cytochrome P450